MQKTALRFPNSETLLLVSELPLHVQGWLLDGEIRQHSKATLAIRKIATDKLLWFLQHRGFTQCDTLAMRHFLAYLGRGHEDENGRWGNQHLSKPVRPRTVHTYYNHLKTFFSWLVMEEVVEISPMHNIAAPISRSDQIQPFTQEQIEALIIAAKRSHHPRRDETIVRFLFDTGVRASELCSLNMKDLDMNGRRCSVLGKGNKYRSIYFGRNTTKALWQYLRECPREPNEPLFLSDRGIQAGEPLTRSGLAQLIRRLGKSAQIEATRCSPHTFRHTFAIEFLRAGGNVFSLKELLGHTSLTMVNRYVALAQADIENQHRQFSPGDRLKTKQKMGKVNL